MSRRETWRPVLDAEIKRWSQLPVDEIIEKLREPHTYKVSVDSKNYQVEAEILENTNHYLHLSVSVDDGTLPWSIFPLTESIVREKTV
ncbi:MAG: hypothetical protein WBP85_06230 [Terracidiphilus sp.]